MEGQLGGRRGCVILLVGVLAVLLLMPQLFSSYLPPKLPHYPNVEGNAHYPYRLEALVLGEAFGGFQTRDSYKTVREYYRERLVEQGWQRGWYKNRAGRCYTLLIIENDPKYARTPPGVTSISFKLREPFHSELERDAPAGCK